MIIKKTFKYRLKSTKAQKESFAQFYPSTKTCHKCGQRHALTLQERELKCSCGNRVNRDVNAAINIKQHCLKAVGTTVVKLVELPH